MKILVTLDFPPERGGIQNYLYEIVKHTFNSHDIVICYGDTNTQPPPLSTKIYRFSFFNFKKLTIIKMIPLFLKTVFKNKKEIEIYCGNIYAALIPWLLKPITGVNYNVYTYGTELIPLKKVNLKSVILRSILNNANSIHSLLESQRELLIQITNNRNIIVQPPKISLQKSYVATDNLFSLEKLEILSVGRLVKHKGHEIVIKALSKLPENFNLTIVGNGPEYINLEKQCNDLSISSRVTIVKDLSDHELKEQYRNSHIFIFPSLELSSGREGFGIAMLEAMEFSIPVIGSNCGGIPEVLGYGDYGLLFEPGNDNSLADQIIRIFKDDKLRNKITLDAYENLRKKYAW